MNYERLQEAAKRYGTPSYVFNLDELTGRLQLLRASLGSEITLCYAMKANPFLVTAMKGQIDRYEVCSPGEFRICERTGIKQEQIVLSGVNKEYREMARVLDTHGAAPVFTVESLEHLRILNQCAVERKLTLKVMIRVTSGNQFGLDEETVCDIIKQRDEYPQLSFRGLQYYSGTQKKKLANIEKELRYLDALCTKLKDEYQYDVPELEYGPGFFVPYFQNEAAMDDQALLADFKGILEQLSFDGHITLEMGRYIAAYCGYYLTSVVDLKVNNEQHYCLIDGGIHHLNYYGQAMAMKHPYYHHFSDSGDEAAVNWNICGSLCTVADVLVKQLPLTGVKCGDVLVFERLGAYSVTEGIYLFLSRDLPQILFYSEEQGYRLVREVQPTDIINSIS